MGGGEGKTSAFTRSYITFCVAPGKDIIKTWRKYTEGGFLSFTVSSVVTRFMTHEIVYTKTTLSFHRDRVSISKEILPTLCPHAKDIVFNAKTWIITAYILKLG
jgi:hypothetical protein